MQTVVDTSPKAARQARTRSVLETAPHMGAITQTDEAAALHNLGLSAIREKDYELAASRLAQAIHLGGPLPAYCESLGKALHAAGKLRQSAVCYEQAIAGDPGDVRLYLSLARVLIQDNRADAAEDILKQALALTPEAAEVWALLGGTRNLCGQSAQAVEALERAIELDPGVAAYHFDLGVVFSQLGDWEQAEAAYRRALQIYPGFSEALNNLGNLMRRRNAASEAVVCFQRALRYRPDYADARYNLGLVLQSLDLLEDAEVCYRQVLERAPDHHAASNNYANVLLGLGRIDEALPRYEHAVRLAPSNREYRVNVGMAQLLKGDFREGWRHYAARAAPAIPDARLWNGEHLEGSSILLLSEQGLGDTIQFIRYTRQLRYEGARVSAQCPATLVELLRTAGHLHDVVPDTETPRPCNWYAPLMHLPAVFGTRSGTIPAEVPYLFAEPGRVRGWETVFRGAPVRRTHLRVGLAWRGGADHRNDRNRSMSPSLLTALSDIPRTTFVSLQKDFHDGCEGLRFHPLPRELNDFADTAALIAHLDLVISVDTAVAHLAGALGCPTWVMLPFAPDWRWMLDRRDSPWYPNMRLFRQPTRGDWRSVLEEVREALTSLAPTR